MHAHHKYARSPQVLKLFEWSSQEAAALLAVHVIIASRAVTGLRNTGMQMKGEVGPVQHIGCTSWKSVSP